MTPSDPDFQPFGTDTDEHDQTTENSPWDWGVVKTPSGEIIPPGACDPYQNDDQQRDLLDSEVDDERL